MKRAVECTKPLLDKARPMVLQIQRWMGNTRSLIVVGDSSFASIEWLASVRKQATVITRLRLEAALYEPAPLMPSKGRPRKKGARWPSLKERLDRVGTQWKSIAVDSWYGQSNRVVHIATGTCVWYHSGKPALPIRWVLIRDPEGKFEPQALLCTDLDLGVQEMVGFFARRWTMAVTFQEARAHLGVETQRQWSDLAIERGDPDSVCIVFFGDLEGPHVLDFERVHVDSSGRLVSQRASHLFGCVRVGSKGNMGLDDVFNVPENSGHRKSLYAYFASHDGSPCLCGLTALFGQSRAERLSIN